MCECVPEKAAVSPVMSTKAPALTLALAAAVSPACLVPFVIYGPLVLFPPPLLWGNFAAQLFSA